MRLKRPYVASFDQVRISREEDDWTTHFRLGAAVHEMTDKEILDRFNEHIEATERLRLEYEHVAIEIPPGRPQIDYFERGDVDPPRWGSALRDR